MSSSTTTAPRTGRAWKATAATGVAIALLAAGGATFAEWADSSMMDNGAAITSGTLTIDGAATGGTWTNVRGTDVTTAVRGGQYLIVPGDSLTYRELLAVQATGDLLTATVSTTMPELTGDAELLAQLTQGATMTLNGTPADDLSAQVVASDEKQDLDVALTFTFDDETDELLAQGQSVDLSALKVTLNQNSVTTAG